MSHTLYWAALSCLCVSRSHRSRLVRSLNSPDGPVRNVFPLHQRKGMPSRRHFDPVRAYLFQLYIGEACWAFLFGVIIGALLFPLGAPGHKAPE